MYKNNPYKSPDSKIASAKSIESRRKQLFLYQIMMFASVAFVASISTLIGSPGKGLIYHVVGGSIFSIIVCLGANLVALLFGSIAFVSSKSDFGTFYSKVIKLLSLIGVIFTVLYVIGMVVFYVRNIM